MRLKPGRPSLQQFSSLFNVAAASDDSPLTVTWLGVSTLLISDGEKQFLTDGFFSRPGLLKVGVGKIKPNLGRITACLDSANIQDLDAVISVHSHFDHVMDAPEVATRTGARFIGSESSAFVARGWGLHESVIQTVKPDETVTIANGELTFIETEHCPPDRYPGVITKPVVPPTFTTSYRCGEAWSLIFKHSSGRSILIQGSAGFVPGSLNGQHADIAYLGVGQLGLMDEDYIKQYWDEMVRTTGARQVVLIHWDDFFRSLHSPLRALPYAGDDLEVTVKAFTRYAAKDGVSLHFPTVWQREDPWLFAR